jgi:hypothetical protein
MSYQSSAFEYMKNKALTDRSKSMASLDLLLLNAVGIGDHSTGDLYKSLDEALDMLVDAEDRLDVLGGLAEYYEEGPPNRGNPPF